MQGVLEGYTSQFTLGYLESETRIELLHATDSLIQLRFPRWSHGRLFGDSLEIRWRRDDLIFEASLLTESAELASSALKAGWTAPPLDAELDPSPLTRTLLLIGVNVATLPTRDPRYDPKGGVWVSDRIARLLRYPIPPDLALAKRLGLVVIDYTYRGYPVITRGQRIVAVNE
jgi:hypothetical protein